MNDDYTTNIHSCSDSDNKRNGDGNGNGNQYQISQVWGTWEELLLTCAVKRHGSKDWDSVAKEVGSRSSLDASGTSCRLKYQDLKRRFQDSVDDDGRGNNEAVAEDEEDTDGEIPWLEQLRSLRVAELRRDVQRCDESILSLQLKVKKLEEENDGHDGDDRPDLVEDGSKAVRSINDETEPTRLNRETSNSTASVGKIADHERLSGDNSKNPDPDHMAATEEEEGTISRRSGMSQSVELGESGTSTVNRKRKGHEYMSGEDNIKPDGNQSQPLIEIIKLIRSHPRGSVFASRLRSQETKDYKRVIRQHLDIKTIEKKMEKGSYVSSSLSFYRDLELLFTNAIVFFPTSYSEYVAAQELRTLVSNEMKKTTGISSHRVINSEGGSLVSKQKTSAPPLVGCKKKSFASKKALPSSSSFKQKDEIQVSEEKDVTTTAIATRSSRRTSKGMEVVAKDTKMGRDKNSNKKQTDSKADSSNDDDEKEETPKTEKKMASEKKKKKKSVAEFLKRIKNNSPHKGKETTSKDQKKSDGNVKKDNRKAKPRELRSNSTGKKKVEVESTENKRSSKRKQLKKEAEEETATATRKRGRESGKDNQQPKKRNKR
ncbi:LOW QUALITY PROTEIN: biorientation of chromosomes in cell division protein 1-like 1 [Brassica napus]|uniref:LOW QUALITY PROTEIN: biorientation of chromosomes in cell division protein 1-like 1 n=1 Tax=Brassica napus TaxID=3708 RepID=UPI002079E6E2|nr:LOW QUALITY PROTEIN: biorientation of chromosomes in cell division protein 1-like 1 [Brassica napus]